MISLPPLWKIKRELRRIQGQFGQLYKSTRGEARETQRYDALRAQSVKTWRGKCSEKNKLALFVIFPSQGVQEGHLQSLQFIEESGFAPLVVSNVPLSEKDRARVLQFCWRLVERPNIGYDFGAYREGILQIQGRLGSLDKLAILNDSCWFPIGSCQNWLSVAEKLDLDFVGAASNYGTPRGSGEDLVSGDWTYHFDHKNFHYCSFALLLSGNVLRDKKFFKFWKNFRMTSQKNRVVRRGEIGLSQWIIKRGYSHGSTLDIAGLERALGTLDDDRLRQIAEGTFVTLDGNLPVLKETVLGDPDPAREALIRLILTTVSRIGASYCIPDYTLHEGQFGFLKKTPLYLTPDTSRRSLALIENLPEAQRHVIAPEAKALSKRLAQPTQN